MRATQLRPGMTIRHEGELYTVHSVEHRTPGNKRAAMATKIRNLRTGSIIDYRFRAEVDIERAIFDEIEHEYLYSDNEGYHFMNTETYEQFHLGEDGLEGCGHRADRTESHRQRGDEGRETRDRTYDSGSAVRQHRRHSQSGYLGSTLRPARVVRAAALRHGRAKGRRRFLQQALQRLN